MLGNDFLGRQRPAGLQAARADVVEKLVLNLVVERNDAVPVETEGIHCPPQLSRQLGNLYSQPAVLSSNFVEFCWSGGGAGLAGRLFKAERTQQVLRPL